MRYGAGLLFAATLAACTSGSRHDARPTVHQPPISSPTSTAAATAAPEWFALLRHGKVQWFNGRTAAPFGSQATPHGTVISAIASLHDGHSILLAARPSRSGSCTSEVQRQTVKSSHELDSSSVRFLSHLGGVPGPMAISADGLKLAMSLTVPEHPNGRCEYTQLVVVNLRNGQRQVWTTPETAGSPSGYSSYFIDPITWSPDNRHLAVHIGQCCADSPGIWTFDTASSTGPLLPNLHRIPDHDGCGGMPYAWTALGIISDDSAPGCSGGAGWVVAINATTGVANKLTTPSLPGAVGWIVADPTGRHFLVDAEQALYRIDNGHTTRIMSLPWDPNSPPAAAW